MSTVLHLAPHPDDELLGAGATLMALAQAGHRVVNLAVGLGEPGQEARRRGEVEEACRRAGFELRIGAGEPGAAIVEALDAVRADVVVSPSPRDEHPAHVAVARAAAELVGDTAWWQWGLWGELPRPNLLFAFGPERLDRLLHALDAHAGELARNDYRALAEARARAHAVLGVERVFGFGSPGIPEPYAELLVERRRTPGGRWRRSAARRLDPRAPLG